MRQHGHSQMYLSQNKYSAAKNSVPLRKNTAEGGCGGNSAVFLQKTKAKPAALLVQSRTQQKSFLFLLEEKIGRAQNQKSRENFFARWRVVASGGGLASLVGVLLKESSNISQKTPPNCTFRKIVRSCLGALRLGMVFPRQNPSIFEGERKRPLGNAEVPVRSTEKTEFSEPIFFLSPLAKG